MTKLDELLKCIKRNHVYVQTHNYPDQDAIASAMGLKALLEASGKQVTICYSGIIDKDNTLKMLELLDIQIFLNSELNMIAEDEIIIVDGQKGNINVTDFIGDEIACIDHHRIQKNTTYRFSDIRCEIGACSSIIASYFIENKIPLTETIATALVYGQKMDTQQMSRGVTPLDLEMFCLLFKIANTGILRILDTTNLKLSDLDAYRKAISCLRVYDNIGIADIGNDCSEAILGSVSDFLLTISEVEFTLVYCRRAGGIKFSVRSTLEHIDASIIIRQAVCRFGGDGGGHSDMAAGFIPDIDEEKKAFSLAQQVTQRVLSLLGVSCS